MSVPVSPVNSGPASPVISDSGFGGNEVLEDTAIPVNSNLGFDENDGEDGTVAPVTPGCDLPVIPQYFNPDIAFHPVIQDVTANHTVEQDVLQDSIDNTVSTDTTAPAKPKKRYNLIAGDNVYDRAGYELALQTAFEDAPKRKFLQTLW
jgi:hypothetical protein